MKTFKEYLSESAKQFEYTIKIAGDFDSKTIDLFLYNMQKYDIKVTSTRQTTVHKEPLGFPHLENEALTIIKFTTDYPINELHVEAVAKIVKIPSERMIVVTDEFDETMNARDLNPKFNHDYSDTDAKQASADYADSYVKKTAHQTRKYDFASTPSTEKSEQASEGNTKSVFNNIKRGNPPAISAKR